MGEKDRLLRVFSFSDLFHVFSFPDLLIFVYFLDLFHVFSFSDLFNSYCDSYFS